MTLADKVKGRFLEFANGYLTGNSEFDKGYIAKREHTIRVAETASWIAKQSDLDLETQLTIELSAILHDIARFEEWKQFHSYNNTGFNHPYEGARMLEEGMIRKFIPETRKYDNMIILAVREHGSLQIPENFSEKEKFICEILRDADRIDIFSQTTQEEHFDRMYNFPLGERTISENVRRSFNNNLPIKKTDVKSKLDMLVLRYGLVKQLTTDLSKKYVKEKRLVDGMADIFERKLSQYYDKEEIEWARRETKSYLAKF